MHFWFMLATVLILIGCSGHRTPPPNLWLTDSITVVANLNEQLHSWRGTSYRYGGMTPHDVDCSGFVMRTFRGKFALQLPRETREQAEVSTRVDKHDLLSGDLVFFETGSGENGLHVGIYDTGNQFIHASTSQGVTRPSLDSIYWNEKFWQTRRTWRHSETRGKQAFPFFMPITLHPARVNLLFKALHWRREKP